MKYQSALMTSASGKIFGLVASRNKGGAYFRHKSIPVNPRTDLQQASRGRFGAASISWRTLTDEQRGAWSTWALLTPTKDVFGNATQLSGQQWYIKFNGVRSAIGLAAITVPPDTSGFASLGGEPVIVIDDGPSGSLTMGSGGTPVGAGAELGLYVGPAVSAGVSYYKGPYQFQMAATSATNEFAFASVPGYNLVAPVVGQRLPWRVTGVSSTADGQRLFQSLSGIVTVTEAA